MVKNPCDLRNNVLEFCVQSSLMTTYLQHKNVQVLLPYVINKK